MVVNDQWRSCFPESLAIFDPLGDSDHSPSLVSTDSQIEHKRKSFKYFSFLSTHPKFIEAIRDAWGLEVTVGSALFTLVQRMKKVKISCRKLNKEGFGNIQQRTKETLARRDSVLFAKLSV